jgi:TP901 family phage tail tape measure protein
MVKAGASVGALDAKTGAFSKKAMMGFGLAGAAAAAFAAKSAESFMKFETTMVRTVTLAGSTEEQMKSLSDQILNVAGNLGKSPQELADALYYTESAGIDAAHAMDVVTVAAKASAVGLGDTQVVADSVTSVLNAYGAENITAAHATDVLVAAVRDGKGEADAIAGAIGRVIPVASEMGVSFDQVGAGIAALTQTGLDANEAVTSLRGIMTSLLNPTTQAGKLLASVGLSAQEVRDSVERDGLLKTLQMLQDQFKGNDEAMGTLFGNVRAQVGVMSLLGKNADDVRKVFNDVANSTGSLDEAFGRVSQTSEFKLQQAWATLQTAMVQFGAALAPLVNLLAHLARVLAPLAPYLAALALGFGALVVAEKITTMIEGLRTALVAYAATTEGAAGATVVFGNAAKYMSGNLGMLAVDLAAVAALFVIIHSRMDDNNRDFAAMSKQTGISAQALAAFQNRMQQRTSLGLMSNFKSFVGTLDGVGDQLDSLNQKLAPSIDALNQMGVSTESTNAILSNNLTALDGSAEGMANYTDMVEGAVKALAENTQAYSQGKISLQTYLQNVQALGLTYDDAFKAANTALDKHGQALQKTGRVVRRFAGMSSKDIKKLNTDFTSAMQDMRTQSDLTSGNFLQDIHKMMQVQKNFGKDMQALAKMQWVPDDFMSFLIQSGPAAIHDFVNSNSAGQKQAIADWRAWNAQLVANGHTLDTITGKVTTLNGKVQGLPSQKNVNVNVTTTYFGKPLPPGHTGGAVRNGRIGRNPLKKMHVGGPVPSLSTGEFPAILQSGEYVMRKSAVQKIGVNALNALNRGDFKTMLKALKSMRAVVARAENKKDTAKWIHEMTRALRMPGIGPEQKLLAEAGQALAKNGGDPSKMLAWERSIRAYDYQTFPFRTSGGISLVVRPDRRRFNRDLDYDHLTRGQ